MSSSQSSLPPVAIVGIGAELPGGAHGNLDFTQFKDFLYNKQDAYEKIPAERLSVDAWKGIGRGKMFTDTGSFIKDLSMFDFLEFGVSSKDARTMTVSTRKLVEVAFLALLDSGIDYRSKNVGCYMAAVDFDMINIADQNEYEPNGSFAGIPCTIANRVSYHLDLVGPSVPVNTACSSGLYAMHLAVQALRSGDCKAAVVGGCQVNIRLLDWILYSQGGVLSPDGKCKVFDESANGFGRAEGTVVMVVKLLEDAIRDGDHIYGTVLGTGVNSAGSAAPVHAPVAEAQKEAMQRAFAQTGKSPKDVDFVELHGTGTAAGDPTEANWVGESFQRGDELLIGSVKGNLGHLEITAFLASLSKACIIFKEGIIPPNANLVRPNPAIKWDEYKLRVPVKPTPLVPRSENGKALIAICSYGIGGANGHVVAEAPPPQPKVEEPVEPRDLPVLLVAAGLSPRSATATQEDLLKKAKAIDAAKLPMLSTIMGRRGRQMTWRSTAVMTPGTDSKVSFTNPVLISRARSPLVFTFSGQGPQHIAMGRELFVSYPAFRESVTRMDEVFQKITGKSLINTYGLFGGKAAESLPDVWPIAVTLPAIAIVQVAVVDLLASVNIVPDIVLGHSAGETSMLYLSCGASKEMVVHLAVARGRALTEAEFFKGTMAAVTCSVQEAEAIVDLVTDGVPEGKLDVACFNAEDGITLSGLESYIEKAIEVAKLRGFFATKLRTRVPIHSSLMEQCRASYRGAVEDVFALFPGTYSPTTTTFSTLTGEKWVDPFTADYFWETTRKPVKFTQAMSSVLNEAPNATFIEISPHPVLSGYIASHGTQSGAVVCPMRRSKKDRSKYVEAKTFLEAVGGLVNRGYSSIDFSALNGVKVLNTEDLDLPVYPFARKHVPFLPDATGILSRQLEKKNLPLGGPNFRINFETHPILAQHIIKGEPIMPAAGYLEIAFELGARQLWNVGFNTMLSLSAANPTLVDIVLDGVRYEILTTAGSNQEPRVHGNGYLTLDAPTEVFEPLDLKSIVERCEKVNIDGFYEQLKFFANYGPAFQRLQTLYKGDEEFIIEVRGAANDLRDLEGHILHPAILDTFFQVPGHKMATGSADDDIYYLPATVDNVVVHDLLKESTPETLFGHMQLREWRPDGMKYDIYVTDSEGGRLLTLRGFGVAKHSSKFEPDISRCFEIVNAPVEGLTVTVPPPQLDVGENHIVLAYTRGNEMEIQSKLSGVDRDNFAQIWFTASTGEEAASARGFARTLRVEVFEWDIRLVVFPQEWSPDVRISTVSNLIKSETAEKELEVDKGGNVTSPRFQESEPYTRHLLPHNKRWTLGEQNKLSYSILPAVPEDFLLVGIERTSSPEGGLRGFIGSIATGPRSGEKVAGIMEEQLSNYAVVHEGWTCSLDASLAASDALPALALGIVVANVSLGASILSHPSRAKNLHILVAGSDDIISASLSRVLSLLRIPHDRLETVTPERLEKIAISDVVISGFTAKEDVQVLKSALSPRGSVFLWNDNATGIRAAISKQPWIPSEALSTNFGTLLTRHAESSAELHSEVIADVESTFGAASTFTSQSLFDSSKAYVLVGGIGSLGIRFALWMYQRGARNIVLTSRGGVNSRAFVSDNVAQRVYGYLRTLKDVTLRLEACDATSVSATNTLLGSIKEPIAGCILLAAAIADKPFFSQTAETFEVPFSKERAFRVLEETLIIDDLDFCIVISTGSTFGNPGQSNYAAANTLMEELTRPYNKAFPLIIPLILDSFMGSGGYANANTKYAHIHSWAMTAEEIFKYFEDAILKIHDRPFNLYVPDFDWNRIYKLSGPSFLYDHLVTSTSDSTDGVAVEAEDPSTAISRIICEQLGIDTEDLSRSVPLTSYGLDSLSAARLSFALKPHVVVTQLQLLGDVTVDDVLARVEVTPKSSEDVPKQQVSTSDFNWMELHKPGETLVKLRDLAGVPLILIHGANGTILPFKALQEHYDSALWAIQSTPDVPFNSVEATAGFYYQEIKKQRPSGPYRLAGFSGTCVITYALALLFETNGDVVERLIMLDHFPLIFCPPLWEWDEETVQTGNPTKVFLRQGIRDMIKLYKLESNPDRQRMGDDFVPMITDGVSEPTPSDEVKYALSVYYPIASATSRFLLKLTGGDASKLPSDVTKWLRSLKAPLTVYLATEGLVGTLSPDLKEAWKDLGVRACVGGAEVISVESGHFSILENDAFLKSIQSLFRQ